MVAIGKCVRPHRSSVVAIRRIEQLVLYRLATFKKGYHLLWKMSQLRYQSYLLKSSRITFVSFLTPRLPENLLSKAIVLYYA